ncbi:MAG: hypothetical protein AAFN74_02230 [Myxococcota bacterium]
MDQALRVAMADYMFNGAAAPTITAAKDIRLFSGNPDAGGTEVTNANGIARAAVTAVTWSAAAADAGGESSPVRIENDSGALSFGTPTNTGTADWFEIHDGTRRIWVGQLASALSYVASVPIEAAASQFDLTFA